MDVGGRVAAGAQARRAVIGGVGRARQQAVERQIGAATMLVGLLRADLLEAKHVGGKRLHERRQNRKPPVEFLLARGDPVEVLEVEGREAQFHSRSSPASSRKASAGA